MPLEPVAVFAVFAALCATGEPRRDSGPVPTRSRAAEAGVANDSSSIGSPFDGRLVNGVPLPLSGPGFRHNPLKDRGRRYGTAELVGALARAAGAVHEALPGSELTIDDLSARDGGDIPGHASHRSGRDVDVSFYLLDGDRRPRPGHSIPLDPDGRGTDYHALDDPADDDPVILDVPRTWKLVEALVLDSEAHVQRIYVVEHVRTILLEHARSIGAPERAIELFADVTCQPAFPHDDHMHIRLFCTPGDVKAGCEDTSPVYPWHRAHLAEAGVEPKLARPRGGPHRTLTSHAEARAKAGAMHQTVVDFLDRREAWVQQPHPGRKHCP
jgi:penicillin-insensitive murein DD-endopeptidase